MQRIVIAVYAVNATRILLVVILASVSDMNVWRIGNVLRLRSVLIIYVWNAL